MIPTKCKYEFLLKRKLINIILIICLFAVMTLQSETEIQAAETVSYDIPGSQEYLLTHGRTYYTNAGLVLPWTGSGFTVVFEGTGAMADISTGAIYSGYEAYVNIYVDGDLVPTSSIRFSGATGTYVLAQDLENKRHTITVRRRSEVDNGNFSEIRISKINIIDGTLQSAPKPSERKIEFIGDSITSGFANMVYDGSGAYTTATSEGTMTYAALTGKALGADTSILAKGGIAVSRAVSVTSFIDNYLQTANFTGQTELWDFQGGSDVVVINLGTNDTGATDANGNTISGEYITSEIETFLHMVRENNPHAIIIWAYGMIGNWAQNSIRAAINAMDDKDIYYLPLDNLNATTEGVGSYYHPTITTNINRSFQLTEFIADKMGWDYDYQVQLQTQLWTLREYDETALGKYTWQSAENFLQVKSEVMQEQEEMQKLTHEQQTGTQEMTQEQQVEMQEKIKTLVAKLQQAKNSLTPAAEGEGYHPNENGIKLKIDGFQISTTKEGFRTVYSVEDPKEYVESAGIVYGRGSSFTNNELQVNSTHSQVYTYEATEAGKIDIGIEGEEEWQHYAMTMKYGGMHEDFFNEMIWVRAYVRLKDGTYVYSKKDCLTIQGIADYLYQNCLMRNEIRHEYLYYNILKKVNRYYEKKAYIGEVENY